VRGAAAHTGRVGFVQKGMSLPAKSKSWKLGPRWTAPVEDGYGQRRLFVCDTASGRLVSADPHDRWVDPLEGWSFVATLGRDVGKRLCEPPAAAVCSAGISAGDVAVQISNGLFVRGDDPLDQIPDGNDA